MSHKASGETRESKITEGEVLKYGWRAVVQGPEDEDVVIDEYYRDEEGLKQRSILEALKYEMKQFQLLEVRTNKPVISVLVRPGMKIIHRRRWTHNIYFKPLEGVVDRQVRWPVWIVGWQERRIPNRLQGVKGAKINPNDCVNVQMLAFVHEDGLIELLNGWRDDHVLYQPVRLMEEELLDVGVKSDT